jgi:membrane dipeptidase
MAARTPHLIIPVLVLIAAASGCASDTAEAQSHQTESPSATMHQQDYRVELTEEAQRIHRAAIVIDGHNDLVWKVREKANSSFDKMDISRRQEGVQTDIPRLIQGGVGAQFWAAYVPPDSARDVGAAAFCLEQMDLIHRMVQRYPQYFEMAYTAEDIVRIHDRGKIACLIGIENGTAIESSLATLRMFYALGARYMTLTHVDTNDWADSATDRPRHDGLSSFGEDVVREMNRLGMLVDISHVSVDTAKDVLRISRAPIVATHSCAYALSPWARNIPDDVLRLIADNGGLVMVNFGSSFLTPRGARTGGEFFEMWRDMRARNLSKEEMERAFTNYREEHPIPAGTVATLVDHIDHIVKVAGIDHVGLGSDYDGVSQLPAQLEDVSGYPYITQELLNRGHSEENIRKILGGNLLRVLGRAEELAGRE